MKLVSKFRSLCAVAAVALVCGLSSSAYAVDPTLPTVGVDISAYLSSAATSMGTAVATLLGIGFVFMIIFTVYRKARAALRG